MLQTAITRTEGRKKFLEFVNLHDMSFTRTQIEHRDGLVFMRAKKRTYVVS